MHNVAVFGLLIALSGALAAACTEPAEDPTTPAAAERDASSSTPPSGDAAARTDLTADASRADASRADGGQRGQDAAADAARPPPPPPPIDAGNDPENGRRNEVLAEINRLRAEKGLAPYERAVAYERCADLQAEDDSKTKDPHNAWATNKFQCPGGRAQNECPGWGGPECVDSMWRESTRPGCAKCDQCPGDQGCAGCDFYGTTSGDVCGHYVSLSSKSYRQVAVGFGGGWMVINFF